MTLIVKKYAVEVTRSALSDLKQISYFYRSHAEQKIVAT
jgi:hypothetical protein